jgi:CBS domain-containing membrane protein
MQVFKPLPAGAHLSERLIGCIGAAIAVALTIVVCRGVPLAVADLPVIVAPLGASAVLVFAVPSSPLAQPWPVVGGNTMSTLVGVAVFHLVPDATIAAGVAVGAAILVMSLLRCLHPPGGATALTAVIGSTSIHAAGYSFAFAPVAINSVALVAVAMFLHRATASNYPHERLPVRADAASSPFHASDIDAALADMHDSFDIARDDLDALLCHAERHARARTGGDPRHPA